MNYENYTVYDFVTDKSFNKAIKYPHSKEGMFWEEWISEHPGKRELIDEARQIILLMNFEEHHFSKGDINSLWKKLDRRIEESEQTMFVKRHSPTIPKVRPFTNYLRLAAAFIGFILFGFTLFLMLQSESTTEYVTQYGETKTLLLPDSSRVILNANSTLKYKTNWKKHKSREVWLSGEALFSVVHTTNHQKFIVTTQDLDIEVLGTEFNVNNRNRSTKVVLNSGQIKLSIPTFYPNGETEKGIQEIIMNPGELVEYSDEKKTISKREVDAEKHIAWSENKLIFEDTPLSEIVQILEDNYGLKVITQDSSLLSKRFTATYPADNIDILLKALSKSFDVVITANDDIFYFNHNNQ